jgi:hypothetical protein
MLPVVFRQVLQVLQNYYILSSITKRLGRQICTGRKLVTKNQWESIVPSTGRRAMSSQGQIVRECPLRIAFSGEIAIDHGGVSREMFSLFWEEAIRRHFEGSKSVTPLVHAHTYDILHSMSTSDGMLLTR